MYYINWFDGWIHGVYVLAVPAGNRKCTLHQNWVKINNFQRFLMLRFHCISCIMCVFHYQLIQLTHPRHDRIHCFIMDSNRKLKILFITCTNRIWSFPSVVITGLIRYIGSAPHIASFTPKWYRGSEDHVLCLRDNIWVGWQRRAYNLWNKKVILTRWDCKETGGDVRSFGF